MNTAAHITHRRPLHHHMRGQNSPHLNCPLGVCISMVAMMRLPRQLLHIITKITSRIITNNNSSSGGNITVEGRHQLHMNV
jgi:hypothetical protein